MFYITSIGLLYNYSTDLMTCNTKENFINMLQQLSFQLYSLDFIMYSYSFRYNISQKKDSEEYLEFISNIPEDPTFVYYRPKIQTTSSFFPDETWEIIYEWLPMRYRIRDPIMVFNSDEDGYSFRVFYRKLADKVPTIIFFKTAKTIFGIYLSIPWEVSSVLKGNRETFLFSISPNTHKYPWNDAFQENAILIEEDSFRIGPGDKGYALSINSDWVGSSSSSMIFSNPPLDDNKFDEEFLILKIEGYVFV